MNIALNQWNGSENIRQALEQIQKQNAGQQRWMLALTAVAAIGAVIAAWPVMKGWLH